MEEKIVTDDAVKVDSNSDANSGLETEVVTTEGEKSADGVTVPQTDAELLLEPKPNPEAAKLAWSLRNERRAREAAEQKASELEAKLKAPTGIKPAVPNYDDFADVNTYNQAVADYHEKLTDWKIQQREQEVSTLDVQKKRSEAFRKLDDSYNQKVEKAIAKYPDYIEIVEKSPFTLAMDESIKKSEHSAEIAYHISKNPELQSQLLYSSPIDVAFEIHKLDLRFTNALNQKKVSSAPAPITPLKGDTSDFTNELTMSTKSWIDKRNKEEFNKRR
ncbi:MAG: hypothetical protein WC208_15885 [Gallionella sp.]|jgi:hypothetical protein